MTDVAVVGSGFSGCLAALILHRIGLRPVVVDRGIHPRFAIGESSTPIADLVLRDLCDRYDLPRIRPLAAWGTWRRTYPGITGGMKRGFSFYKHVEGQHYVQDPHHANELLVAASTDDEHSDTQWFRADVDAFFAQEVRAEGIPLYEGIDVEARPAEGGWLLTGPGIELRAAFLVDTSGGGALLASTLHLPQQPLKTASRALFSHFRGLPLWQDGMDAEDYPFPAD